MIFGKFFLHDLYLIFYLQTIKRRKTLIHKFYSRDYRVKTQTVQEMSVEEDQRHHTCILTRDRQWSENQVIVQVPKLSPFTLSHPFTDKQTKGGRTTKGSDITGQNSLSQFVSRSVDPFIRIHNLTILLKVSLRTFRLIFYT